MLRKDDVVYYKVKLLDLIKEATNNGIKIELDTQQVSFYDNKSKERTIIRIITE